MEKFLTPTDINKLIDWLLNFSLEKEYILVAEYKNKETYFDIINNSTKQNLPLNTTHHYNREFNLLAFSNPKNNKEFISILKEKVSVLSFFDKSELCFLIADDFDEECFSCSSKFYDTNYLELKAKKLIK
jgi:hypothetical protein